MRRISILLLAMVAISCLGASGAMAQDSRPAIMLHVDAFLKNACNNFSISGCSDILTSTDRVDPAGGEPAQSFVYVLAMGPEGETPETPDDVRALQFGIWYNFEEGQDVGIKVLQWTLCADQDFKTDDWPNNNENITVVWVGCRSSDRDVPRLAGFLYMAAYSPSLMQLTPKLGNFTVSNCAGAEVAVDYPSRAGWVTFGGASGGGDTDGCNSCLEDCGFVPVEPETWGGIKSKFSEGE